MKFYKHGKVCDEKLQFTINTKLESAPAVTHDIFYRFAKETPIEKEIKRIVIKTIDLEIISFLENEQGIKYQPNDEEFIIRSFNDNILIYSNGNSGTINGIVTFLRLLDDNCCFNYTYIWDYPCNSFRGVKLFIPAREDIEDFKSFIDMMMFFRNNTIMLEIGGAMEYKRHPEINDGWIEYSKFMSEHSGKTEKIQEEMFPWRKNSIHAENGGGSYLTQEEIKDLIVYANERGITIIPEVPSSSHCDYMLTRHPELAERPEDPYPDTFCISNPASYDLLFDILDEVIEVFNPKVINVGHDEFYSINICDRCRKRLMENYELFAEDLTKIHDYLASKNVKTMIWCDKLLNIETKNKMNFGGALNKVFYKGDVNGKLLQIIQPTWQAREMIPKDIICMNWHWIDERLDNELKNFPVVLGNFNGLKVHNYKNRFNSRLTGGVWSNWGATKSVSLQLNIIYFIMCFNEILFWDEDFDSNDTKQFTEACEKISETLFNYKYYISKKTNNNFIEVIHTTNREYQYKPFYDGLLPFGEKYDEDYLLGKYVVQYEDKSTFEFPIYLGEHISYEGVAWFGEKELELDFFSDIFETITRYDDRLLEATYSTLPIKIDGKTYYKFLFENPYLDKKIIDVKFVLEKNAYWSVDINSISY